MDTAVVVIICVIAAVVVLALLGAWLFMRRRHTSQLRDRFGGEYNEAVAQYGSRGRAEAALERRAERVSQYPIRQLSPEQRSDFTEKWIAVQAGFVDDPAQTVAEAQGLVNQLMAARGYPVADFDQQAEDLSVDHPVVVQQYREAHGVYLRSRDGATTTDELRAGFTAYRGLFEELLSPPADFPAQWDPKLGIHVT